MFHKKSVNPQFASGPDIRLADAFAKRAAAVLFPLEEAGGR